MDTPEKGQAPELDLEDQLSEMFDEMEAGEREEEVEEVETEAEAAGEDTPEAEAEEDREGKEEVGEDTEPTTLAEEEQQEAEDSGYTEPAPERWPAEMKEVYNKLPTDARKLMMEQVYKPMQAQYTQSTMALSEMKKNVEPMLESLNQYRNDFERMGMNPVQAFQQQVAWAAHFARVGPEQGIKDMQDAYGLGAQAQGQQDEQYLTPVERAMKKDVEDLKKRLEQTAQGQDQYLQQQAERQQQEYVSGVRNELQSFCNEQKDGKPAHPHIEKVAPAVAGIIRGGLVNKTDQYGQPVSIRDQMAQAYDMAVRLDPSLNRATDSGEQAARAKAAKAVDVVANNPAGEATVSGMSIEEQLDAEYDRLSRRTG